MAPPNIRTQMSNVMVELTWTHTSIVLMDKSARVC